MGESSRRGASTVIGVLLLVGVAVIVGSIVAVGALTFLDGLGTPQATADFNYEQTAAGLEMTPRAISTAVSVQLNGREVATFEPGDAGKSVLLPTAPDDRITVVSEDGERSVLVQEEIDERSEIGDFIAYYTFESESGDTLEDQSGNGNDGELSGETDRWTGNSYDFGGDDNFDVSDITTEDTVDEFTIAVVFEQDTAGGVNQLVEHYGGGNEWYIETSSGSDYKIDYAVNHGGGDVISTGDYSTGQRQVVVGTFDTNNYELFVDGQQIKSGTYSNEVKMGNLVIGADAPDGNSQYLDGEIYEIRLYYTAFDDSEVQVITNAME